MPPKVKIAKRRVKSKEMTELSNIFDEFKKSFENPSMTANADIIYDKFIGYRNVIHEFFGCVIKINVGITTDIKNKIMIRGLNDLYLKLISQYGPFKEFDTSIFESYLSPKFAPKDDIVNMKRIYSKMVESDIIISLIRLNNNIKNGMVHKFNNVNEYIEACKRQTVFLQLMNNIEVDINEKESVTYIDDLCDFFRSKVDIKYKEKIFNLLREINVISKRLYDLYMTPDIDTSKIHEGIVKLLETFKKELRGNTKGLSVIEKSADLFRDNFKKYWKTIAKGGNMMSIITDYIEDVADNATGDLSDHDLSDLKLLVVEVKKLLMKKFKGAASAKTKIPDSIKEQIENMDKLFDTIISDDGDFNVEENKKLINELTSQFGIEI